MKFPIWATIFTITGIVVLCGLGIWQLERLVWKRDLLLQIEKEYEKDINMSPITVSDFKEVSGFKRGYIEGVFLQDKEILIQPRVYNGVIGYHVLTPFLLSGTGELVLVNRGWVPKKMEGLDIERPSALVRINGLLRVPPLPNWFTPVNHPESGIWYSIDPFAVFKFYKLSGIGPRIFYQEGAGEKDKFPVPQSEKMTLNNNHAQYALFWFFMAFTLGTIYWVKFFTNVLKLNNSKQDYEKSCG